LGEIALLQLELENYSESEANYLTCLDFFTKQHDRLGQAAVLGVLGTLFFKKGDNSSSIDYYSSALNIYEELNQFQEVITCRKSIGNCYLKLNKLDEACDEFLECSAVCSDYNDIYNLLDCLGNLILIHEMQEKWDVVFELYKKSLKAFKEIKDNKGIIISYFNLGIIIKKQQREEEALRYFKKGTNFAIDSNYSELIIKGLSYVGETLFYLGRIKEAKDEFIKALHIAEKIAAKNAIIQIKVLLKSFGLGDEDIKRELEMYKKARK
jgi:tetratricopeptide (TPR) repeat protein